MKNIGIFAVLASFLLLLAIFGCTQQGGQTVYVCSDGKQVNDSKLCSAGQVGNQNQPPQQGNNNRPPRPGEQNQKPGASDNQSNPPQQGKQNATLSASALNCIAHTKDNPECKDCCDCLANDDGSMRTGCRDTCATHDFSMNSEFITVSAPSTLGENGDYSACTAKANSGECKTCCEGSMGLQCGDYRFCRTACNNKFGNASAQPAPGGNQSQPQQQGQGGNSGYSIEQAISDKAQLSTLAFDGLGFLTGNLCSDSFLPPGKVSDFFGFQYLRDTTQAGKGHSTDFVTNSANNVLYTLNSAQKAKMLALAKTQAPLVNKYAYGRYPLMEAFRRQLEGDIPSGKTALSKSAVMAYSSDLYELDANISIARAKLFAETLNSLNATQKQYLDNMVKGGFASWPSLPDQVDKQSMSHDENVLMMTYASEMFGWYAGNVEADTYFCPERQGDYFGGFYIKDAPAIGNAGYTIDESITGDAGEAFIAALDSTQQPIITGLVNTQRPAINSIVEKRREISAELRKALTGSSIDEAKVRALAREYGALDGEISYYYATAFANVGATLTSAQKAKFLEIRNLDGYPCEEGKIYLYSEKISQPTIIDTGFLFE